ncbi:MAG: hypothetical protein WAP35_09210 [Solirubrobacterales bacterium]
MAAVLFLPIALVFATWTRPYEGDSPAQFVISLNVHRRQLTTGQRAEIARVALPALVKENEAKRVESLKHDSSGRFASDGRQPTSVGERAPRNADLAGELVGVSGSAVNRITKVAEQRPDLHQKVKAGEMTVNAAHERRRNRV